MPGRAWTGANATRGCRAEWILGRPLRVFPDSKTGNYQIEWWENGGRRSKSLKHRDWAKAKRQCDEFAANYVRPEPPQVRSAEPEPLTLEKLFEMYMGEVSPTKGERTRKHDRAAAKIFLSLFGSDRDPSSLSKRDWDRFIRERSTGRIGGRGGPIGDRTVERNLRWLLAVLNWATQSRDECGELMLERNPLKGYRPPIEKNPVRVVLSEDEYGALCRVSRDVDWRFQTALVLAHETGHRIGAIRALRWSDVDLEEGTVRWRAEHEKNGYEHETPLTGEAIGALEEARRRNPGIGDAPVLPAPKDASRVASRDLMHNWWVKAENLASLEPKPGRGWHFLRRKFASDYMHVPLKTLSDLGGWKTPAIIVECYQQADDGQMRQALADRRRA